MICARLRHLAFYLAVLPCISFAQEVIEFPDEELATESVLPVFDLNVSVRSRMVNLTKRFELSGGIGYSLLEPFFSTLSFAGTASYHFTEEHGINLWFNLFMPGVSDYTSQLNPVPPTSSNANIQFAPAPKYMFIANYQYTPFYGKISLSKSYVIRLNIYGLGGLGMISVGDSNNMVLSGGFGQRFYFSPRFALRLDLRFYGYSGPDILSRKLTNETSVQAASTFSNKFNIGSLLGVTLAYTFGGEKAQ